jgi:hypothetical protein
LSKSKLGTKEERMTNTKIGSKVSATGFDQENTGKHKPKTETNRNTKENTETQQSNKQTATSARVQKVERGGGNKARRAGLGSWGAQWTGS